MPPIRCLCIIITNALYSEKKMAQVIVQRWKWCKQDHANVSVPQWVPCHQASDREGLMFVRTQSADDWQQNVNAVLKLCYINCLLTYLLTATRRYHIKAGKLNTVRMTFEHSDLCRFPASDVAILLCAVLGLSFAVKLTTWLSSGPDVAAAASPPATGEELITHQPTMCWNTHTHTHKINATTCSFALILSVKKSKENCGYIVTKFLQSYVSG